MTSVLNGLNPCRQENDSGTWYFAKNINIKFSNTFIISLLSNTDFEN